jgi:hypothetical protein
MGNEIFKKEFSKKKRESLLKYLRRNVDKMSYKKRAAFICVHNSCRSQTAEVLEKTCKTWRKYGV